jgi:RNA polymerase sigma-70 factor (ECF subfamily)
MVVRTGLGPRLRERVELSDVVQEALVEVVRQFPQFTGQNEAALVGWLRRLVGQKLADLGRYHSRAKRKGEATAVPLHGAPDAAGRGRPGERRPAAGHTRLSRTSPSQAVSKREQIVLLADAFAGLRSGSRCLVAPPHEPRVQERLASAGPEPEIRSGNLRPRVETFKRSLEGPPVLGYGDGQRIDPQPNAEGTRLATDGGGDR